MVAVPCRRFVNAARWNGHAPQTTTGAARVSDSHCQLVNCSAGIIAIAITGTVSASEISNRCRSDAVGSSCAAIVRLGCGQMRLIPGILDHRHQLFGCTSSGYSTRAFSVAKFTVAATPSILFSFFSIRAAHDAHVIPSTKVRSSSCQCPCSVWPGCVAGAVTGRRRPTR